MLNLHFDKKIWEKKVLSLLLFWKFPLFIVCPCEYMNMFVCVCVCVCLHVYIIAMWRKCDYFFVFLFVTSVWLSPQKTKTNKQTNKQKHNPL